jgi:hypothetical protein
MEVKNEPHEGNSSRATPSFRSPHVVVEMIKRNGYIICQLINITYRKIFLTVNSLIAR